MSLSKRWAFTLNNPGDWTPQTDGDRNGEIAFMVWQTERGAEGTTHIQGYVRFHSRKRLNTAKNLLGNAGLHLEIARGSEEDNRRYCTKEDTRAEGTAGTVNPDNYDAQEGKQGRRSDLEGIAEQCRAGHSLRNIAQEHPGDFIRYHAGIAALHAQVAPAPPAERIVMVTVLWGDTGVGKTHRVMNAVAAEDLYIVSGRGRDPWGMYRGEQVLLMDEFNWELWSIQEMNGILDKWRFRLDARYHDRYAAWTRVYICCNESPVAWYPAASQPLIQSLRRRIQTSCRLVLSREPSLGDLLEAEPNPQF